MGVSGTITDIQFQKRDPGRVSVFLDGTFAFGLKAALAEGLVVGQQLTVGECEALQHKDMQQKALQLSWDQLSRRPRTEKELRDYLERREIPQEAAEAAVQQLKQLDYLNDTSFARQWIENRQAFRPRSRTVLRYELQQKGVAPEIVAEELQDFDDGEAAAAAAEAAVHKYRNLDPDTRRRRLTGYLSRRGFRYDTIRGVLENILEDDTGEV